MKSVHGRTILKSVFVISLMFFVFAGKNYIKEKIHENSLIYKEDFYRASIEKGLIGKLFSVLDNQVAFVLDSFNDEILISLPFKKQEHPVTCEIASLRIALNYLGENVTEEDLIEKISFDTRAPKNESNIWGDPDLGFVGSVDGKFSEGTGYGVFENPINNLASEYRKSKVINGSDLSNIINEVNKRNPVIVWGLLSDTEPTYWKSFDGKTIKAYPGEHTRVVIGYSGSIQNPEKIILMDPMYGRVKMSKERFLFEWNRMDKRAVVIY